MNYYDSKKNTLEEFHFCGFWDIRNLSVKDFQLQHWRATYNPSLLWETLRTRQTGGQDFMRLERELRLFLSWLSNFLSVCRKNDSAVHVLSQEHSTGAEHTVDTFGPRLPANLLACLGQDKPCGSVSQVWLDHGHTHLCAGCHGCFCTTAAELNSCRGPQAAQSLQHLLCGPS